MTIKCIGDYQLFQSDLDRTALKSVDGIKDLGVIIDEKMSFWPKWSRMLGFIKRISREFHDPYTHNTLYISLVRPNFEHADCVWSPHQSVQSERLERVQHNFIRYAVRRLTWRVWPFPAYDARYLLIGLEMLSDRRIVTSALFVRDILVSRVDCSNLVLMLRFEEVPYSSWPKWCSFWGCWLLIQRSLDRIPGKSWSFSEDLALD
jgi:hypothetical protein